MSRFRSRRVVLTVALLSMGVIVAACKADTSNPYLNTGPTPTTTTLTFTGSLINSGDTPVLRLTHTFTTTLAGTLTLTVTDNTPDSAIQIGFGLGVWDSGTSTCGSLLAYNNTATTGTAIIGNALAGSFCVQAYDVGNIPAGSQTNYTITVTHY